MSENKKKRFWTEFKRLIIGLVSCIVFAWVFFWASGDQLFYEIISTNPITASDCAAVMTNSVQIKFKMKPNVQWLDRISLLIGTYGRQNQGELLLQVYDENESELGQAVLPTADLADYVYQDFIFETPIKVEAGSEVTVVITAQNVPAEQGVSLWYGNSIDTGRVSVPDLNGHKFTVDGVEREGKICYSTSGRDARWFGNWYWLIAGALIGAFAVYGLWTIQCLINEKKNVVIRIVSIIKTYSFLIRQLVARDFKKKYKNSALGVLWSFLNPLLTMLVQYLVFSTIFKSSIENFIVYLLSGIILFNFFGEAVGLGLNSIIDNGHLINKVYMPKAIYPLSRVLSSSINLLISMLPLVVMMLVTGLPLTKAMFLIPIGLLSLLVFCLGMSLLLSTAMVFFRDTSFLWNIISTLWMYLTPTFYPVDIIPEAWLPIYKLNPMYQYITFLRSILLDGIAPSLELYAGCIISAVLVFVLGYWVFKKNQDKFVLYL